jgi:hypothetical protein
LGWCLWGCWCGFFRRLVWRVAGRVVVMIGGEVVVVVVVGEGGDGVRVGGLVEVVVEGGMIRRHRTLAPGRSRRRRRRRGSSRGFGLGWRAVRPRGTWRATEASGTMSGPTAGPEGDGEAPEVLGLALGLASVGAVAGRRAPPAGGQAHDRRALGTGQPAAAEAQEEKIRRISMVRLCTVFRSPSTS